MTAAVRKLFMTVRLITVILVCDAINGTLQEQQTPNLWCFTSVRQVTSIIMEQIRVTMAIMSRTSSQFTRGLIQSNVFLLMVVVLLLLIIVMLNWKMKICLDDKERSITDILHHLAISSSTNKQLLQRMSLLQDEITGVKEQVRKMSNESNQSTLMNGMCTNDSNLLQMEIQKLRESIEAHKTEVEKSYERIRDLQQQDYSGNSQVNMFKLKMSKKNVHFETDSTTMDTFMLDDYTHKMPKSKISWQKTSCVPKLNLQLDEPYSVLSTTTDQYGPFTPPTPSEWSSSSSPSEHNVHLEMDSTSRDTFMFDDHMPKPKTSWQRPPGVPKLNLQLIDELLSTTSDQCGPFTPPTPSEWSPSSSASQINDCELFTPPTPSEWSSPDSD